MDYTDMGKGNMLLTYIFTEDNPCRNIDHELEMQNDLQELAEKWKEKGYIRRYMIAPDDVISEPLKNKVAEKLEATENK